jgi:hypothetical protein
MSSDGDDDYGPPVCPCGHYLFIHTRAGGRCTGVRLRPLLFGLYLRYTCRCPHRVRTIKFREQTT